MLIHKISVVHEELKKQLKVILKSFKSLTIIAETIDAGSCSLLNITGIPEVESSSESLKPFLLDTVFKNDEVNHATVAQAIITVLVSMDIAYSEIVAFFNDNARFITKYVRELLLPLCKNAVYITSEAHIISFVGGMWRKNFLKVDKFVVLIKHAFRLSSKKKAIYKAFLEDHGIENPKAPPAQQYNDGKLGFVLCSSIMNTCSITRK